MALYSRRLILNNFKLKMPLKETQQQNFFAQLVLIFEGFLFFLHSFFFCFFFVCFFFNKEGYQTENKNHMQLHLSEIISINILLCFLLVCLKLVCLCIRLYILLFQKTKNCSQLCSLFIMSNFPFVHKRHHFNDYVIFFYY